jgi:hypothetical protein
MRYSLIISEDTGRLNLIDVDAADEKKLRSIFISSIDLSAIIRRFNKCIRK